jgi:hypothetical protein
MGREVGAQIARIVAGPARLGRAASDTLRPLAA